jgi:hypothetical protein
MQESENFEVVLVMEVAGAIIRASIFFNGRLIVSPIYDVIELQIILIFRDAR